MKKKSIFRQLLFPLIAIVCALAVCLTGIIAVIFTKTYEDEIYSRGRDKSLLVSNDIATFLDGAYGITEELSVNPSILTMKTEVQTPILTDCVNRNPYLELLYIQGTDGMQTGRSSGELADRSTRWWFVQTMEEQKAFISKSYYSVNTGMPCASIFFPMYKDRKLTGIFAVDLKLDYLQSLIEEFSDMEQGEYSFVIDGEGVVVAHPDSTQIEELYNYRLMTKTVSKKDEAGQPLLDADGGIITEEQSITVSEDYQKIISEVMAGNSGSRKIKNGSLFCELCIDPLKGTIGFLVRDHAPQRDFSYGCGISDSYYCNYRGSLGHCCRRFGNRSAGPQADKTDRLNYGTDQKCIGRRFYDAGGGEQPKRNRYVVKEF